MDSYAAENAAASRPDVQGLAHVWPRRRRMTFALDLLFSSTAAQAVNRPSSTVVAQKRPLSVPSLGVEG